jgi:hypothetical protein
MASPAPAELGERNRAYGRGGPTRPSRPDPLARALTLFTPGEWGKLGGMYGFIAFLHVLGWGLFLGIATNNPAFAGAGVLAYTLGLRHGFGLFLGGWLASVVLWRVRRVDERYGDRLAQAES